MRECLQEHTGGAWDDGSWFDLSGLDCVPLHCWWEQIMMDPGIIELTLAQPNAHTEKLSSTSITNVFGKLGTKYFEVSRDGVTIGNVTYGNDELLDAWALRARFGEILPCVGEPCVAVAAGQNGIHLLLEGEELKVSVHQAVPVDTATGGASTCRAPCIMAQMWS